MDITTKEEYNKMMGFSSVDIGSHKLLLKEVVKRAKAKGYRTARFYTMNTVQLRAVLRKFL